MSDKVGQLRAAAENVAASMERPRGWCRSALQTALERLAGRAFAWTAPDADGARNTQACRGPRAGSGRGQDTEAPVLETTHKYSYTC